MVLWDSSTKQAITPFLLAPIVSVRIHLVTFWGSLVSGKSFFFSCCFQIFSLVFGFQHFFLCYLCSWIFLYLFYLELVEFLVCIDWCLFLNQIWNFFCYYFFKWFFCLFLSPLSYSIPVTCKMVQVMVSYIFLNCDYFLHTFFLSLLKTVLSL